MRSRRNSAKKIRILVADREGVFRLGLKRLFGLEDNLRVVAQAESSEQVLAMIHSFKPDLAFVQAEIAEEGDGGVLAKLHHEMPRVKVVITSSAMSEDEALRYVKGGAAGVILKSVDPSLFVKSVRKIMENEILVPKLQAAQAAKPPEVTGKKIVRPVDTLTHREKTIISCLLQGWRNREIAQHLSITEQTVKNHLRTVYDKVGVSDRLELVLYAIHQRMELPTTPAAAAAHP